MSVRRLFVLLCGYEIIPLSVSLHDADARFWHAVPISAYLLDTSAGWVLVDTGLDERRLHDPGQLRRHYLDRGWDPPPLVRPEHELHLQLVAIGVTAGDVRHVILTHLHADHTGHLRDFPQAMIHVQRAEYEHALQADPPNGYIPDDYLSLTPNRFCFYEADWDLLQDIRIIATPGHTPGHQSVLVSLPGGRRYILAGDVGDLRRNLEAEILPGETTDEEAALASIRRINRELAVPGTELLLCHDPGIVHRVALAPECVHPNSFG